MELTPNLQQFLKEQYDKYCEQMSIKIKPLLLVSISDLPSKGLKISVSLSMRNDKKCVGLHYPSATGGPDLIFIDVKRHKNRKHLKNTLVHELCHCRFKEVDIVDNSIRR